MTAAQIPVTLDGAIWGGWRDESCPSDTSWGPAVRVLASRESDPSPYCERPNGQTDRLRTWYFPQNGRHASCAPVHAWRFSQPYRSRGQVAFDSGINALRS